MQNYWAFCANPKRYRIADAVGNLETDYWTTTGSKLRAGDWAIVWQTRNAQGNRGVVAFAEILADPRPWADEGNPYWTDPADGRVAVRVPVRYIVPEACPLWIDKADPHDFLSTLSVARAHGGTVFHVTEPQWRRLCRMAALDPVSLVDTRADIPDASQPAEPRGQGFQSQAAARRAVELHAMALARRYFQNDWEWIIDVSAGRSYDLLCKRDGEEIRVEVKGTTGTGDRIFLTRNEVAEAAKPGYVLFVVSDIELDQSNPEATAAGGRCRKIDPVALAQHALEPVSYQCTLDWTRGDDVTAVMTTTEPVPAGDNTEKADR